MKVCKQRSSYDCFLACVIMVSGKKSYAKTFPKEFRELIHRKKGTYSDQIDIALGFAGLKKDEDYWLVMIPDYWGNGWTQLLSGRRAIIQVSSLNLEKANHAVYWDGHQVIDPSPRQKYRWLRQLHPQYVWIFNER